MIDCLIHSVWGCLRRSPAGLYVLWLVYLLRRCIPLVLERQWDLIVLLSSSSLHLSVQLKRPINNGAPHPSLGLSPHSCAFEVRKNETRRKRKHNTIHKSHVCLCSCTGGLDVCQSFQGCGGLSWFIGALESIQPTVKVHPFLYLPIHFNPVCPHTSSIHLTQTDVQTCLQTSLTLTAAPVHQRYEQHYTCISLQHMQTTLGCSQEVFGVSSDVAMHHHSSVCIQ